MQGFSDAAGVVQLGDPVTQEFQDAFAVLPVEFAQFAGGRGGEFNLPGHGVSGFF